MADRTPKAEGKWPRRIREMAIGLGYAALGWAVLTVAGVGTGFWTMALFAPLVALDIWLDLFPRGGTAPLNGEDVVP